MKNIFLKLKIVHHTFHHKFSVKVSKEILKDQMHVKEVFQLKSNNYLLIKTKKERTFNNLRVDTFQISLSHLP